MLGSICGDILGSTYEFGIENQDIFCFMKMMI